MRLCACSSVCVSCAGSTCRNQKRVSGSLARELQRCALLCVRWEPSPGSVTAGNDLSHTTISPAPTFNFERNCHSVLIMFVCEDSLLSTSTSNSYLPDNILTSVRWYLMAALISISLMTVSLSLSVTCISSWGNIYSDLWGLYIRLVGDDRAHTFNPST